jgi:hypothetical protein
MFLNLRTEQLHLVECSTFISGISFFIIIIFLLLCWGYTMTFTEVLTIYQIHHSWIHPLRISLSNFGFLFFLSVPYLCLYSLWSGKLGKISVLFIITILEAETQEWTLSHAFLDVACRMRVAFIVMMTRDISSTIGIDRILFLQSYTGYSWVLIIYCYIFFTFVLPCINCAGGVHCDIYICAYHVS